MEGYKTYTGIAIALLGVLNMGHVISIDELNSAAETVISLIGLAVAVYGRYKAKPKY